MSRQKKESTRSSFRLFFVRGLAIVLPTALTIWILIAAYNFVQGKIAEPINGMVKEGLVRFTAYPVVTNDTVQAYREKLETGGAAETAKLERWEKIGNADLLLRRDARRSVLHDLWAQYRYPLDMIGLVIAILLIWLVGRLVGSFLGRRIYARGEKLAKRLPLLKQVYPFVKQVTDYVVGGDDRKVSFNRVVAVEYPRKGLWSVGLVTGNTMQTIQREAEGPCLTVFIPSSPTPFTGYVITVPEKDTIDLPVTIEEALRFTVSAGVIVPAAQVIPEGQGTPAQSEASAQEGPPP